MLVFDRIRASGTEGRRQEIAILKLVLISSLNRYLDETHQEQDPAASDGGRQKLEVVDSKAVGQDCRRCPGASHCHLYYLVAHLTMALIAPHAQNIHAENAAAGPGAYWGPVVH